MRALSKMVLSVIAVIGISFGFQLILRGLDDDGPAADAQIEEVLTSYHEDPVPGQCSLLTTERFRSTVYGGSGEGALEACREHQEAQAELPKLDRSIFIGQVRIEGEKAVAEVRAGGISITEKLVEENGEWRLDEEVSPFGNFIGPDGLDGVEVTGLEGGNGEEHAAPKELGSRSQFTNVPGSGPQVAIALVAKQPVDPGVDRTGAKSARIRLLDVFGQPGPLTEVRFVNLPITLVNIGEQPFRGEIGLFATADNGRELIALDRRELTQRDGLLGRRPDWITGEAEGIAPGERSTRYLTVAVPVGHEIVEWRVEPRLLTIRNSVSTMQSLDGNTYR